MKYLGIICGTSEESHDKQQSPDIQNDVIMLLQSRMDKCTNEQFWAVGSHSALLYFLITHIDIYNGKIPLLVIIFISCVSAAYASWYVYDRHKSFYNNRDDLVRLLSQYKNLPLKHFAAIESPYTRHSLSGVVYYIGIIVIGCVGMILCLL